MSFVLSKLFWELAQPATLLLLLLVAGCACLLTGRRRAGTRLLVGTVGLLLLLAVVPVGPWLLRCLESRFPGPTAALERVNGIIVLGGAIDPILSAETGDVALNGHAERLAVLPELMRRWPAARVVFTGGSGFVLAQTEREAPRARQLLAGWAVDTDRILFEGDSRNTWENALYSKALVTPQPGEVWLLVTSALHMPRSVGIFRRVGWEVVPWPVDRTVSAADISRPWPGLTVGLGTLTLAVREIYGLVAYRLMDRTSELYPGPDR